MGVQAGQLPAMEPPQPRLCHLTKWPHFQGYGFNLHTNKSEESQLVGNVDPESPADAAGVKKGDRIIEVNGTNISNENHAQVVARIKAGGEETRILVADRECFDWHRERSLTISSSLTYVLHLSSERPASPSPSSSTSASEEESAPVEIPPAPVQPVPTCPTLSNPVQPVPEEDEEVELEEEETRPTSPPPPPEPAPDTAATAAPATDPAPAPSPSPTAAAPAPAPAPAEHSLSA